MALVATTQLSSQIASRQTSCSQNASNAADTAKQRFLRLVQASESRPGPFPILTTPVSPLSEPPCSIKITDTSGKPISEEIKFRRISGMLDTICRYVERLQGQNVPRQSGVFETITDSDIRDAMRGLPSDTLKAAYDDLLFISKHSPSEEVRRDATRICWKHYFIAYSGRVSIMRPPSMSPQDSGQAAGK